MVDPHQHLFNNLMLLHEIKPGGSEFIKCVKENMFAKPNRAGFDQALFYLCSMYDPVSYISKVPWPILDRSQERVFRQNTVAFIKDIIKIKPEAGIPPFSPSFHSTPGGERLTKFMWKFSLLVLKTVVERESDFVMLDYPTAGLNLLQRLSESTLKEVARLLDDLCQLIIDASTYAKKLSDNIVNQSEQIKRLRLELAEVVQCSKHCPLSFEEKKVLLEGDCEQSDSVLRKWQTLLDTDAGKADILLRNLKDQSIAITRCYDTVKTFVNGRTMPVVLDASLFPTKFMDAEGNLDLSFVLSEGANAARTLLNSLSMYGGFQSYESVLPSLENIREQLQGIEISAEETKAGFMELISTCPESTSSSTEGNDQAVSPLKGRLQLASKMLQDAQTSTPPLVFNVQHNAPFKSLISAESPLIDVAAMRLPSRVKSVHNDDPVSTPKASQMPGTSRESFTGRIPFGSSLQTKNVKSLKGSQKFPMNSSVLQTPANFHPKPQATSTAHKLSCISLASIPQEGKETSPAVSKKKEDPNVKKIPVSDPSIKKAEKIRTVHIENQEVPIENIDLGSKISDSSSEDSNTKLELGELATPSSPASPQLLHTPAQSPLSPVCNQELGLIRGKNVVPEVVVFNASSHDEFNSPQSTCGMFSPTSPENSFYSLDVPRDISGSTKTKHKFSLDFGDEISPSGRISLCPSSDILAPEVSEAPVGPVEPNSSENASSRRKSLQAIINRYRDIVSSSKPYEAVKLSPPTSPEPDFKLSPPTSPEPDLPSEDFMM